MKKLTQTQQKITLLQLKGCVVRYSEFKFYEKWGDDADLISYETWCIVHPSWPENSTLPYMVYARKTGRKPAWVEWDHLIHPRHYQEVPFSEIPNNAVRWLSWKKNNRLLFLNS